jgi:hypothetical protein
MPKTLPAAPRVTVAAAATSAPLPVSKRVFSFVRTLKMTSSRVGLALNVADCAVSSMLIARPRLVVLILNCARALPKLSIVKVATPAATMAPEETFSRSVPPVMRERVFAPLTWPRPVSGSPSNWIAQFERELLAMTDSRVDSRFRMFADVFKNICDADPICPTRNPLPPVTAMQKS